MFDFYQPEISKIYVNIHIYLYVVKIIQEVELFLNIMVAGDNIHRAEKCHLSEYKKMSINQNNFSCAMIGYSQALNLSVENKLASFRVKRCAVSRFQVEGIDVNLSLVSLMPKIKA